MTHIFEIWPNTFKPITSEPIEWTCEQYSMCDNGVLVNVTCPAGTSFSEADQDCIDGTLNPDCDVDECLDWINGVDTTGRSSNYYF